ncbi:MAG: histidine kinase [Actinomycetia bacterium]|nr:histidine kinase [Actinomycetes bacterium]
MGPMRIVTTGLTLNHVEVDAPPPFSQRMSARQWLLVDVAWAALTVVVTIAAVVTDHHGGPFGSGWDIARIVLVVALCAALPLRRTYPRAVLVATTVLAAFLVAIGVHGPVTLITALALYTVAANNDRRTSLITVGAPVAAIALGALLANGTPDWGATVSGPAVVVVGWLAGENARTRRAYIEAVTEQAAEREREREERVRRAAADERVRIARELHDVVAHAMSLIAVRSGVARVVLDTKPDEARDALGIIETTSRRALQEMRLIVGVLRNPEDPSVELSPAPGLDDLDELIQRVGDAGVPVQTHIEGTVRPLPAGMDLSAYRIIQEALTNVVRHAGPTTAQLRLRYAPDEFEIELTDEGGSEDGEPRRASNANGGGHGLVGMRERVALYGGRLSAERTGRGFRVVARLPTSEAGA